MLLNIRKDVGEIRTPVLNWDISKVPLEIRAVKIKVQIIFKKITGAKTLLFLRAPAIFLSSRS